MSTDDAKRDGLRERKKRATRAMLSWAAIRLAADRGYDNVRVEDIAEEAGVSPRTFNNYFSSKGEAIAARHLDRCLLVAEELRRRPASEPLWEAITQAALAQLVAGPEVLANPVPERGHWVSGIQLMMDEPAVQREILRASAVAEAELAAAVAARTGTDAERDLHPQLVAAATMAAITVIMRHSLRSERSEDITRLVTEAFAQIAAGLPTP